MEEAIKKGDILIEALPYIKKFFKKNVVIKFGGNSIGEDSVRKSVLEDIVFMNFAGMNTVLVHGGGPYISERMKKSGIKAKFVDGLRVTDKETMDIVDSTLVELNHKIVEEIRAIGAQAFGLSGKENKLLVAEKLCGKPDVGFVGKIKSVDTTVLDRLLDSDIIPVISPVAMGEDGMLYNVNADEAAAAIAAAIKAEKMLILTNVDGIMRQSQDGKNTLLYSLSLDDVRYMIDNGMITGGMIPKAKGCLMALEGKVRKTHIVSAKLPHAMLLEIFTDKGIGTEIVKLGRRTKATLVD
ncbi:MAG: acetylglutamate kinase [Candidatus Omnitrophota bacterium]